jgi:hypothetical protein
MAAPEPDGPYRERYCAFLDILGFRELVEELKDGKLDFKFIQLMLQDIHNPPAQLNRLARSDFKAQSISDAVAISAPVNASGLLDIITAAERMTIDMLLRGYFVRGAVVRGRLYHDDQMVFGEALIHAYQLESQIVRYPRIMLTRPVADDFLNYCNGPLPPNYSERIRCASDGPWHLHVVRPNAMTAQIRDQIRLQLERKLNEAMDHPAHFEKVKWFADYWNEYVDVAWQIAWPPSSPSSSLPNDEIPF